MVTRVGRASSKATARLPRDCRSLLSGQKTGCRHDAEDSKVNAGNYRERLPKEGRTLYVGDQPGMASLRDVIYQAKKENGRATVKYRATFSRQFSLPPALDDKTTVNYDALFPPQFSLPTAGGAQVPTVPNRILYKSDLVWIEFGVIAVHVVAEHKQGLLAFLGAVKQLDEFDGEAFVFWG